MGDREILSASHQPSPHSLRIGGSHIGGILIVTNTSLERHPPIYIAQKWRCAFGERFSTEAYGPFARHLLSPKGASPDAEWLIDGSRRAPCQFKLGPPTRCRSVWAYGPHAFAGDIARWGPQSLRTSRHHLFRLKRFSRTESQNQSLVGDSMLRPRFTSHISELGISRVSRRPPC